jgi:hypothetical protein
MEIRGDITFTYELLPETYKRVFLKSTEKTDLADPDDCSYLSSIPGGRRLVRHETG